MNEKKYYIEEIFPQMLERIEKLWPDASIVECDKDADFIIFDVESMTENKKKDFIIELDNWGYNHIYNFEKWNKGTMAFAAKPRAQVAYEDNGYFDD